MNKKKIGLAALALALCIGIASATLLSYFGSIQTEIVIKQSVLLDSKSYEDMPVQESLTNVHAGYYYGRLHTLKNYANIPASLLFDADTSVADGITPRYVFLARLLTIGDQGTGTEASIVIPLEDTTLGDLKTIAWLIYTVTGYPAHVDITLGTTDPDQSMLTAEMAYNNAEGKELDTGLTPTLRKMLSTFELASKDGFGAIGDNTMFWVTKMGAGNDDAPYGTLAQWKDGIVGKDPEGELTTTEIDASTQVLQLEIEVDNWVLQTEAYIGKIEVNGVLYTELPVKEVSESFILNPNELLYFCIEYYIPIDVVGTYTITTEVQPA